MNEFRVKLKIVIYAASAMTEAGAVFIRVTAIMSSVRKGDKRASEEVALEEALTQLGLTRDGYERLQSAHTRGDFYRSSDGEIVVPNRQILGMLKETAKQITTDRIKGARLQSRIAGLRIEPDEIPTGKKEPDGYFERPVRLRGLGGRWDFAKTPILRNLELSFTVLTDVFKEEEFRHLFTEGARLSSIGGCRKVGKGRFTVEQFARADETVSAEPRTASTRRRSPASAVAVTSS